MPLALDKQIAAPGRNRDALCDTSEMRCRCTRCGKKLLVRSIHAGKRVVCKACGEKARAIFMDPCGCTRGLTLRHLMMLWFSLDVAAFVGLGWLLSRLILS